MFNPARTLCAGAEAGAAVVEEAGVLRAQLPVVDGNTHVKTNINERPTHRALHAGAEAGASAAKEDGVICRRLSVLAGPRGATQRHARPVPGTHPRAETASQVFSQLPSSLNPKP